MAYNHISKEDRRRIEALTQAGSTNKEIAAVLGKSVSTIERELKHFKHFQIKKLSRLHSLKLNFQLCRIAHSHNQRPWFQRQLKILI